MKTQVAKPVNDKVKVNVKRTQSNAGVMEPPKQEDILEQEYQNLLNSENDSVSTPVQFKSQHSVRSEVKPESPKPPSAIYQISTSVSQPKDTSNELYRGSTELQSRVKKAIQKSMDVIKKFKSIKDTQ